MDSQRIYKDLGTRVRILRKGLGKTQDEVAKQAGISRASLANIEAGRQQVLVHHLFALAKALQLEAPGALLLTQRASTPRKGSSRRKAAADLPLSDEGLTEKQRREVLGLMGDALNNNTTAGREDQ